MNLTEFILVPPRMQNGVPLRKIVWGEIVEEPYVVAKDVYYGFFHEWINKFNKCNSFAETLVVGIVEDMEGKLFLINLRDIQFINEERPININPDNVP